MKVRIFSLTSILLLTLIVQTAFGLYLVGENTIVRQTKEAALIVAGQITDVQSGHLYGSIYTDAPSLSQKS